jgi:hypothetical protein
MLPAREADLPIGAEEVERSFFRNRGLDSDAADGPPLVSLLECLAQTIANVAIAVDHLLLDRVLAIHSLCGRLELSHLGGQVREASAAYPVEAELSGQCLVERFDSFRFGERDAVKRGERGSSSPLG